jgi:hypothetical protein
MKWTVDYDGLRIIVMNHVIEYSDYAKGLVSCKICTSDIDLSDKLYVYDFREAVQCLINYVGMSPELKPWWSPSLDYSIKKAFIQDGRETVLEVDVYPGNLFRIIKSYTYDKDLEGVIIKDNLYDPFFTATPDTVTYSRLHEAVTKLKRYRSQSLYTEMKVWEELVSENSIPLQVPKIIL